MPAAFKRHALARHTSRWEFMKFPVHCASYAFSPDYHDENIFGIAEVMRETREMLHFFAFTAPDYQQALREFRDYKTNLSRKRASRSLSRFSTPNSVC